MFPTKLLLILSLLPLFAYTCNITCKIQTIIKQVFCNTNCISYIENNAPNMNFLLENVLISGDNTIRTFSPESKSYSNISEWCKGFIVATSNISALQNYVFNTTMREKPIYLIFSEKPHEKLKDSVNLDRYTPLLVTGLNFDLRSEIWRKTEGKSENITVKFLTNDGNKVMYKWKNNQLVLQKSQIFDSWHKKRNVTISAFHCPPYIIMDKNGTVTGGLNHEILKTAFRNWPIYYNIYEKDESIYEKIITDITSGKSKIGGCAIWLRSLIFFHPEEAKIEGSYFYLHSCGTFLVPKPLLLEDSSFLFQPFNVYFWVFCALPLTIIKILSNDEKKRFKNRFLALIQTCLAERELRRFRIIELFGFILLSTYYSAGLSSCLTSPLTHKPVNSINDIIIRRIQWEAETNRFVDYFIQTKSYEKLGELYINETGRKERKKLISKMKYARLVQVLNNNFIANIDKLDEEDKNKLKILPSTCFDNFFIIFMVELGSLHKYILNKAIKRCHENGLLTHWYSQAVGQKQFTRMKTHYSVYNYNEIVDTIGLAKLQGAFYLISVGFLAALVTFIFEMKRGSKLHYINRN